MLTGQTQQNNQPMGYTGIVSAMGQKINVNNGLAEYEGKQYFISNNGEMVIDKNRNLIGYVKDGEFKPMDQGHHNELKQLGLVE